MTFSKCLIIVFITLFALNAIGQFKFANEDTLIVNLPEEDGTSYLTLINESDSLSCLKWKFEIEEEDTELLSIGIVSINFDFVPGFFDSCPDESLNFECINSEEQAQIGFYINSYEEFIQSDKNEILVHYTFLDNPNCDSVLLRKPILFIKTLSNTNDISLLPIDIYPNPVYDYLEVKSLEPNLSYQIFTRAGQRMMKGFLNGRAINTSDLVDGLYIIKLMNGESQVSTKRFIKSK